MTAHTPGPWERCWCWEAQANARLSASAPELLRTLELIAACDNPTWTVDDIKDMARVAIAKVKGPPANA